MTRVLRHIRSADTLTKRGGPVPELPLPISLVAHASFSPKGNNQDAVGCVRHRTPGYTLVAVADGIGSHPRAEVGARLAIEAAVRAFRTRADPNAAHPRDLVAAAAAALGLFAEKEGIAPAERERTLGTTLICAVETPDEIRLGWVGNGAAFLVRPSLLGSDGNPAAAWAATNLLSPHCTGRNGKSVLARFLSAAGPGPATEPTTLTLARDRRRGEILLLCTDGLSSADQVTVGTDDQGKVWQLVDPALPRVLSALAPWAAGAAVSGDEMSAALAAGLEALDRDHLLEDDCTVAVLCSRGREA